MSARISRSRPTSPFFQRWPDVELSGIFAELHADLQAGVGAGQTVRQSFERICRALRSGSRTLPGQLPKRLRRSYGAHWLQALASLLGMLMHFRAEKGALHNPRRPGAAFSTYPNPPYVSQWSARALLSSVARLAVPGTISSRADADRFSQHALGFRILDPSMESGQMLLAIALEMLERIHRVHPSSSRAGRLLGRSVLQSLTGHCLWGIDRNELALPAVSAVFALLGEEYELDARPPANLLHEDSLAARTMRKLPAFDGVLCNPPWGEAIPRAERDRLPREFATVRHQADTYVAFSELSVRLLRPRGAFTLILPAQVLGSCNAGELRRFLLENTRLSNILVLPRPAFAQAGVRGVIVAGRTGGTPARSKCRVTVFPFAKDLNFVSAPHRHEVPLRTLHALASGSWWPRLTAGTSSSAALPAQGSTVRLGDVADVHLGVQVYGLDRGTPKQTAAMIREQVFLGSIRRRGWSPAVRGRDVRSLRVLEPTCFVRLGPWLARPGRHKDLRWENRVFVRELCRRDGQLECGIPEAGPVPLHGVLTVVPRGIEARVLAAILSSAHIAAHVRTHAASLVKVDFQRITAAELRSLPIPVSAVQVRARRLLGLPKASNAETQQQRRLKLLAESVGARDKCDGLIDGPLAAVDLIVAQMYRLE